MILTSGAEREIVPLATTKGLISHPYVEAIPIVSVYENPDPVGLVFEFDADAASLCVNAVDYSAEFGQVIEERHRKARLVRASGLRRLPGEERLIDQRIRELKPYEDLLHKLEPLEGKGGMLTLDRDRVKLLGGALVDLGTRSITDIRELFNFDEDARFAVGTQIDLEQEVRRTVRDSYLVFDAIRRVTKDRDGWEINWPKWYRADPLSDLS